MLLDRPLEGGGQFGDRKFRQIDQTSGGQIQRFRSWDHDDTDFAAKIGRGEAVNILLVGSGGREHALAWALAASPLLTKLYCAPGNAGIAEVAECVPIPATDFPALVEFAGNPANRFRGDRRRCPAGGRAVGRVRGGRHPRPGAVQGRRRAGRLQGFRQRPLRRDRHSHRRLSPVSATGRRPKPSPTRSGFPRGDQGRRPGGRQGRDHRRHPKPKATRRSTSCSRAASAMSGHEIVVEEFMEGEEASFFALSDGAQRHSAGGRAGSQARRRRRYRPQHRRHGRLLARRRS